ncbi:MAG: MazG family protein [Candidatus Hydrogenedentota bacterium]
MSDPAENEGVLERLIEIMARLRAPDGCPWDREQTHETLKKYAVEETYELLDAIDSGSDEAMIEELGDLLLQVVFHAQMASEEGRFTIREVVGAIAEKLIERHPHVFGDREVSGVAEVIANWEEIKRKKKEQSGGNGIRKPGKLDGVPRTLPALLMTYRIAEKLGTSESEDELAARIKSSRISDENLGDLLRDIALLAQKRGLDPEEELRRRNLRWIDEVEECSR